ncbi:MAG: Gfo/Idh/MocA family oxidoreductase [Ruminococcaceae bacterium]|nr:Gfo/Idh/MocA family oxidoreductase [Oscillospiraceae bacterium]
MIRYATIGRGAIVDQFIAGAAISGEFVLAAVYSRNEENGRAFAQKHGCDTVYTDLAALAAAPDIEAVYIASPNSCHVPQSEQMLRAGKHVICEKPIATSASDYCRLKALADERGLVYMEAIIPRYVSGRAAIKEALASIGNIASARIDFAQLTSRYEALQRGEQVNIFDMSLAAGTLMDLGVYCVYAAVDLLGMPRGITAIASYLPNGADCSGTALFDYGRFTAALTYTKVGHSAVGSEITGDKGTLVIERIGLYVGAYLVQNGVKTQLFEDEPKEQLMSREAAAFAAFIRGENLEEYKSASDLAWKVHTCMDTIKQAANIRYGGEK